MNELTLHPNVYRTGTSKGLLSLLEKTWVSGLPLGKGTIYVVSGFANYNGGVRFYDRFREHTDNGGKIVAIFGGSASSRLSSKQVVTELLEAGAEVHLVNRKRLMHAKCYGALNETGETLVVTSGNFTGPGMSQNVELSLMLDQSSTKSLGFSWTDMIKNMLAMKWDIYQPTLKDLTAPAWQLLYDEVASTVILDETDEVTLVVNLGHADTARIMASPGTSAGKGTQYFWLSKDSFDFFPPLTTLNRKGYKTTYSTTVNVNFIDLKSIAPMKVTYEAENNQDFRLGTGPLRYTKLAAKGDLAAITRRGENDYELRILRAGTPEYSKAGAYALNFIGHQGKKYGYIGNADFDAMIGLKPSKLLPS